jgi:hypothetical protein
MRTALSFWQMPADDLAFFDFLRSTGVVRAGDHQSLPRSEAIEFGPLSAYRRRGSGLLLLCRECDVGAVGIDRFKAEGNLWHTVDPFRSPVLTYGREKPSRGVLPRSSIGGFWDYAHPRTGERRKKDPEFIAWGKAVIAWVRARCTERCELHGFDYPATPDVAAAVAAREIALAS